MNEKKPIATKRNLVLLYLLVYAVSLLVFWCFIDGGDAMGYSLIFQCGVIPAVTFAVSLLIGKHGYWGNWKWISVPLLALMGLLSDYFTFQLANMIANEKFHAPDNFAWFFVSAIVCAVGLIIGDLICKKAKKIAA